MSQKWRVVKWWDVGQRDVLGPRPYVRLLEVGTGSHRESVQSRTKRRNMSAATSTWTTHRRTDSRACCRWTYLRMGRGLPPKLSGFVGAFQFATPGSNPKHTLYAFICFNLNCDMLKRQKEKEKNNGPWWFSGQRGFLLLRRSELEKK